MDAKGRLIERFQTSTANVGIIGMGYVGVPTLVSVAEHGFTATGIAISTERVRQINAGESYIEDVSPDQLAPLVQDQRISATTDYRCLKDMDVVLICVPTPLTVAKEPDLTPLKSAVQGLALQARRGQLIILQSTTYPGTTEELLAPALQQQGLIPGEDVFVAFSPERVDPGNRSYTLDKIPRIVGGITLACTEVAAAFLRSTVQQVHTVSNAKSAEMAKLLENTFRSVNIALVNEIKLISSRIGVDIWEVVDAAASKPFGFMPFYPGPGAGGHCIPVDPLYLSWKARQEGSSTRFIDLAAEVNEDMPRYIAGEVEKAVQSTNGKGPKDACILALGVAYKADISDVRESPSVKVLELLAERGYQVSYHDAHVPKVSLAGKELVSQEINQEALASADCVVVLTAHSSVDYAAVGRHARLVVDTRNAVKNDAECKAHVVRA